MKMDADLIRQILLQIEATPANQPAETPHVDGHSEDEVYEHLELLHDAGLVEAKILKSGSGRQRIFSVMVQCLTWEGHEFIGKAQSEGVWQRTKDFITDKGLGLSLDIIKAVLTQQAMRAIGLPPT